MLIFNLANRLLKTLMVIAIGLMSILVFTNVVLRYGFNSNLAITEELGRYLFVWLTFMGIISAFVRNTHIRVDSIYRRMPPTMQKIIAIISDMAMIGCCVIFLIGCWRLTLANMTNLLPISEVPVAALYFAGVPCSLALTGMLLVRLWRKLTEANQGEKA